MMRKITVGLGVLLALLAVFARVVGLAHGGWGSTRTLALCAGLALIALALAPGALESAGRHSPRVKRIFTATRTAWRVAHQSLAGAEVLSAITLVGISIYFTWFASLGLFPSFRQDFNPYVDLGESFLHGQVALLQQPDPRLAQIADPWNDVAARSQIPYTFDLSYYHGKYYLYWGPVPALTYAAFELVTGTRPPDQFGILLFTIGLGALLTVLLFLVRRRWFPRAPAITIPLFVLAGLINLPQIQLVMHSNVYETAVVAGQFFLFLGLVGWIAYLAGGRRRWLVLAGLGYALAIGSRINLLFSVGVFSLFVIWQLYRESRTEQGGIRRAVRRAALFLAPILIMAMALAGYNFARFGNPLDIGYRYQLAKPGMSYKEYYAHAYSPMYVPANLYAYVLYPLHFRAEFPFMMSIPITPEEYPRWATPSPFKDQDEIMYGAAFVLPLFWLLIALVPASLPQRAQPAAFQGKVSGRGLMALFFLGGLVEFVFLLIFYFSGERYLGDFSMLWLMALALALWIVDERLARLPRGLGLSLRMILWLAMFLLALATVLVGVIGALDLPPQHFRIYNPAGYSAIRAPAEQVYYHLVRFYQGPSLAAAMLRLVIRR